MKNKRMGIGLIIVVVLLVSAWVKPASVALAKTYELTCASPWSKGHPSTAPIESFMDLVNKQGKTTDGNLVLKWLGGPETIKATDQSQACRAGSVDVIISSTDYVMGEIPEVRIVLAPAVWTLDNWLKIWRAGVNDLLDSAYKKTGLKVLFGSNFLARVLVTKKPFTKLADLKGTKIRVGGGKPVSDIIEYIGASPVTIASSEVYPALERGVFDGAQQGIGSVVDYKYWEITPYMSEYYIFSLGGVVAMNLEKFNHLPASMQKKLLELSKEQEEWCFKYWKDYHKEAFKTLKSNGMKFIPVSAEERKAVDAGLLKIYQMGLPKGMLKTEKAFRDILSKLAM
jgi:TRAP-type C4-dicarboxylate transport system substrate-binding protein